MKVALYSDNLHLISQWEEKINLYICEVINDKNQLQLCKNMIIVLDYASCYKDFLNIITKLNTNNNKVLLLDNVPTFEKGRQLLSLGVKGYGNTLMNAVYLDSALQTVQNNLIWIYPEFTTSLIESFGKSDTIPSEITEKLTNQELKIASLIKDGFTNQNISENLEISINTVKSHIKNIYEKLNVKNRLSLTLIFRK